MKYISSIYNLEIKRDEKNVYVYNTFTGAFSKIKNETYSLISSSILDDEFKCEHFDILRKEGFIKPLNLDEFNKIILKEQMSILSNDNERITFVIVPSLSCNLKCSYCFQKNIEKHNVMTKNDVISIVKFIEIKLKQSIKNLHVTWFGGEPLMSFDLILLFSNLINELIIKNKVKYTSSIITNGTLLNKEKIDILVNKCYITNFQITIDGTEKRYCEVKKATKQQFYDLLESLHQLVNYAKVTIRLNCDKNNYNDLKRVTKEIVDFCGENSNLKFYLAKIVDYSGENNTFNFTQKEFDEKLFEFDEYVSYLFKKEFKPRLHEYRSYFCGLVKINNLVIGPNCELYKCEHDIGIEERIIGNIKQGLYYNDYLLKFLKNTPLEKCRECNLFPICLGGCPSHKYNLPAEEICQYSEEYIIKMIEKYITK